MHFSYSTAVVFGFSILISGIIGILRFNQIRDTYRPFIYLIWIGCFNEMLSLYLALNHHYTIVNSIIYSLCESILLLWFFKKLGLFKRKHSFNLLAVLFVTIWLIEVLSRKRFGTSFTYYFNVIYYFSIVLLSIRAINDLLFTERELLKNPTFLICIGLIIFFTYGIVHRMFWLAGLKNSPIFLMNVQSILIIINFLTNLIYALAVLWMRKRQAFTLQF